MAKASLSFTVTAVISLLSILTLITGQEILIEREPSSLLIPANETGEFTCRAHCMLYPCLGYWIINSSLVQESRSRSQFELKGFMFPDIQQTDAGVFTLRLTVHASVAVNNTRISCQFIAIANGHVHDSSHSKTATLLVITELTLSPNPSLERNTTHLTLLWSPPFLWPGNRIQYYNITFTNRSTGSISYSRMNSTYNDQIVTFAREIQIQICSSTELKICISAISSVELLESFCVADRLLPLPLLIEFSPSAVNTSVYFKANGKPVLAVYIQLPETNCSCQKLTYMLSVANEEGDVVTQLGPISHLGSGVVREIITSNLKENKNYSLSVKIKMFSQTLTSHHDFILMARTTNSSKSSHVYIIVMSVCLCVAVLSLLALMCLPFVYVYINRRRIAQERTSNKPKSMVCTTMIPNPIYEGEGPVYESVQPKVKTPTAVTRLITCSDDTKLPNEPEPYDSLHALQLNTSHPDDTDKLSHASEFQSKLLFTDTDEKNSSMTYCIRSVADLDINQQDVLMHKKIGKVEDVEDYAVMNPVGSVLVCSQN